MGQIRPETEADRTREALTADGLTLPLAHGTVQIEIMPCIAATTGGQRLISLLVNVLTRMKGVVREVSVINSDNPVILSGTPLYTKRLIDGLAALVASLNSPDSTFRASLTFGRAQDPDVRVQIGAGLGSADIVVASDPWRALLGRYVSEADWDATSPIGPALAAVITAVEVFKRLVAANTSTRHVQLAPADFAYSAINYQTGSGAAPGPDVSVLELARTAIIGCGAGGSGTAYILGMHPRVRGILELIEPGIHKLSNLNRYLAATAQDVSQPRHKLSSLTDHLVRCAPGLALGLHPRPWEQLDPHPWEMLISAVDTVETRWAIQRRTSGTNTAIIDLAVDDLLYSVLRVTPGGWCLFCKHPYDPDLALKQRALRWGVPLSTIRDWTEADERVDHQMLKELAHTQGKDLSAFTELLGMPFTETPRLLECGSTELHADVPAQAPILPLATSAAAVIGAAEIIKHSAGIPSLDNWLAHDLRRNQTGPWIKHRKPLRDCPHHNRRTEDSTTAS